MPTTPVKATIATSDTYFEQPNPAYAYKIFALGRALHLAAVKGRWRASEAGYSVRDLSRREACCILNRALQMGSLIQFQNTGTGASSAVVMA